MTDIVQPQLQPKMFIFMYMYIILYLKLQSIVSWGSSNIHLPVPAECLVLWPWNWSHYMTQVQGLCIHYPLSCFYLLILATPPCLHLWHQQHPFFVVPIKWKKLKEITTTIFHWPWIKEAEGSLTLLDIVVLF